MERVANPSVEFSVSRKKSPSNFDDVVWFKKMMGFHRQENDPGRPFDGVRGEGVGGGGGGGPDNCNGGGATEAVGPTYGDGVSSSRFGGEIFATSSTTNSRPPSDIFAAAYSTSPYKSPEEMAANAAFPFTFAQWKELERQAMIYKYMISSVPVPPDLLFPHSRNCFVAALDSPASLYNVRYSSNGDPEPGRCKRTDGKKWRCSRDVAPHQKYCERHLHRGRPRSRKPVEVRNNGENFKKTRIQQSHATNSAAGNDKSLLLFNAKNDVGVSDAPSYAEPIRGLSLMKEDTDQRLQLSIERNMGYDNVGSSVYDTSSSFHQNYVEQQPLNALPYSNFLTPEIDAPIGIHNPESSLNLSIAMSCGNVADQEMGSIEWRDDQSVKDPRWNNPALWEAFARGGPLAEALQLGSAPVSGYNNVASPRSAPATTVSSPTGVLHRTLFSHSDSSVCNSPTPAAPTSEMGVQQLD